MGCRHIVAGRIWLLTLDPLCTHGYRVLSNHGCPLPPPPLSQVKHSRYRGVILSHGTRISKKRKSKVSLLSFYKREDSEVCSMPEGVCTDDLQSRKPRFLLSAMHNRAFSWFFAAPLVFLLLGFLFLGFLVPWFSCSLVFLFFGFLP